MRRVVLYPASTCILVFYPFFEKKCKFSLTGFVEKEIKKANIPILDTGENPEVPFPRDMIDLEVTVFLLFLKYKHKCCHLLPSSARHPCDCFPTGHIWEAGERAEGNKHQPRSTKEELPGTDRAQAHSASHTTIFWWGQRHCVGHKNWSLSL